MRSAAAAAIADIFIPYCIRTYCIRFGFDRIDGLLKKRGHDLLWIIYVISIFFFRALTYIIL
jgi:hypothetical protein